MTQKRVGNSRGKCAFSVRATEVLLYNTLWNKYAESKAYKSIIVVLYESQYVFYNISFSQFHDYIMLTYNTYKASHIRVTAFICIV